MFAAYFCALLKVAIPVRVCIFVDGENFRHTIVNLHIEDAPALSVPELVFPTATLKGSVR